MLSYALTGKSLSYLAAIVILVSGSHAAKADEPFLDATGAAGITKSRLATMVQPGEDSIALSGYSTSLNSSMADESSDNNGNIGEDIQMTEETGAASPAPDYPWADWSSQSTGESARKCTPENGHMPCPREGIPCMSRRISQSVSAQRPLLPPTAMTSISLNILDETAGNPVCQLSQDYAALEQKLPSRTRWVRR